MNGWRARAAAGTAVLALVPFTGSVPPPPRTAADLGDMSCRGGKLTWNADPPITFSRLTISFTAHADLSLCISRAHPEITSGTLDLKGAAKGGCPDGVSNGYGTATYKWDDGSTSTAQGAFSGNAGQIVVTGARVTKGLFAGDTNTWTATTSRLDWFMCLTPWGIATAESVVDTLVFLPQTGTARTGAH